MRLFRRQSPRPAPAEVPPRTGDTAQATAPAVVAGLPGSQPGAAPGAGLGVLAGAGPAEVSAHTAAQRQARRLAFWARVVLVPVALIGAVLSFRSLYDAATPTFGPVLAAGFPALVDLLILGSSLQYVAGAKIGRPLAGWKMTAYAGVAGTLILNALAAKQVGEVPWHVTAPAVWAVLVELTAAQVLGEFEATHHGRATRIPLSLWVTAPVESARTRLLMGRQGIRDAHTARIALGVQAAAREALRLALPDRHGRRVRRIIKRQLRAGSLPPAQILGPLGWASGSPALPDRRPETILRAVIHNVLDSTTRQALHQQDFAQHTSTTSPMPTTPLPATSTPPPDVLDQEPPDVLEEPAVPRDDGSQRTRPLEQDRIDSHDRLDATDDVLGQGELPDDLERADGQLPDQLGSAADADLGDDQDADGDSDLLDDTEHLDELDDPDADDDPVAPPEDPTSGDPEADQRRRLIEAIAILQAVPRSRRTTGPELRAALQANGWTLTDRTATRVLSEARAVIDTILDAVQADPNLTSDQVLLALQGKGWTLTSRTASRLLGAARVVAGEPSGRRLSAVGT